MDVSEVRLDQVLGGTYQYRVPLYQRVYSWRAEQLNRLWSDIVDVAEERKSDPAATHFTGSLVLSLGVVGPGNGEFLVVDGQQRLTTLSVLLCALRDYQGADASDPDSDLKRQRLHEQFIVDRFKSGDARFKVLPTQADRDSYRAIVDGLPPDETSNLSKAYNFFVRKIAESDDPDDPHDIAALEAAVLSGLAFVSITARGENVYRIFESLNNTGMRLTQGDLVRNYVFMRLGERGEYIYDTVWRDMQQDLSSDDLADLFWIDLIPAMPTAKRTSVHTLQSARMQKLSAAEIEDEVRRFARLATVLRQVRHPDPSTCIGERLLRLREWNTATAEPLLVYVLQQLKRNEATEEEAIRALEVVEAFFVRRLLGAAPDAGLTRLLLAAVGEVADSTEPIDIAVRRAFSTGRRYYFTDDQIRTAVRTLPFYYRGAQKKLLLSWLEQLYPHRERAELTDTTIEHVMPQTLTEAWREMISVDLAAQETTEQVHEELIHTLGNLTLTAYNTELSNKPFAEKRLRYLDSHIEMTKEIGRAERWSRTEILARADALADRVTAQWIGPIDGLAPSETDGTSWKLVDQAVAVIPMGRWTSYGELAALAGSHPVPLGGHLAAAPVDGAWRVLQAAGTISPGFRWLEGAANVGKLARDVLEAEGLHFNAAGRADPAQKISAGGLAELLGMDFEAYEAIDDVQDKELRFLEQLSAQQSPDRVQFVVELMNHWRALGGAFRWGYGRQQTSCTFAWPGLSSNAPIVVYPRGTLEVNFQYLKSYLPFNDLALRREFRSRLERIPAVRIKDSLLGQRPSIPLDVLTGAAADRMIQVLTWFHSVVDNSERAGTRAEETDSATDGVAGTASP